MTTRGFCAYCGMPECIIDGIDGRECFHCGDGAPMPVAKAVAKPVAKAVAKAVAAERARCAAVCREVATATRADGGNPYDGRAEVADECAEAIERGAVER